jgi:hypothetical protein
MDPVPDSGPGAGRLATGSIEPPEMDESSSVALHLPALALGFCWETGGLLLSRAVLLVRPLCLADS